MTSVDLSRALKAVRDQYSFLPPVVHTDDARTLQSRILAGVGRPLTYEHAVHQAALALALVVAVDRAETADPHTGEAA